MSAMQEQERLAALFATQEESPAVPDLVSDEQNPTLVDFEDQEQARLSELMDSTYSDLQSTATEEPRPGLPDINFVTTEDGEELGIRSDVMVRNNPDPDTARKARIGLGGLLEGVAETLEMPFKVIAGAIDETTAMLGRDISESGAYPIQNIVDDIVRFDETVEMILPKRQRTPITNTDFGIEAFSRGVGSAVPISGGLIAQGQKTLTAGAKPLTVAQQVEIAKGATPRTATDILGKNVPLREGGPAVARSTISQRAAADPGVVMATDALFATTGGVGAGLGAATAGDQTAEGRAEGAAIGELFGIGAGFFTPVAKTMVTKGPLGFLSRYAWKKSQPTREVLVELFDRENFSNLTLKEKLTPSNWKAMIDTAAIERYGRKDVLEHIDRFLRTDEVKTRVSDRIRAVNELNGRLKAAGVDAHYQPGLGALIGTEESKAFQQMTDYHNYDFALQIQHQNKKALAEARKLFAKDPSFKYGDEMADLFEMMAKDTENMMDNLEGKMDDVAASFIEQTFANAGTATREGELLRRHYENMQDVYNKLRDDMYELVDLPDNIKFKTERLKERVTELLQPDRHDSVVGSKIPILERILPKALEASGDKGMDFKTLDNFRKRVGSEYRTLKEAEPHSPHLKTLSDIQRGIDTIIDRGIDQLGPEFQHVKTARDSARTFFRKELQPRFRQGALDDIDSVDVDGSMKISDDSIMYQFWERGDKTQGARDFNRLFANFDNVDGQYFDKDQIAALGKDAKEAQESLFRFALGTLRDDITAAGKRGLTNPEDVLDKWRHKYRGALSEFPDIARRTENLEDVFKAVAEEADQVRKQRVHLSQNVIAKYMRTDPSVVTQRFLSGRREAQSTLDLIDSIYGHNAEKAIAIRDALEVNVMNHILNKAQDPITKEVDYRRIAKLMNEAEDVLPLILGQEDMKRLIEFNTSLAVLADQPTLLQQAELNDFKKALEAAGVSPASILSRYYSASLGKVGPIYLGTDAATRFFTKKAEVYFKDLYREIMYNPKTLDDLEDLLYTASQKSDPSYVPPETQKFRAQAIFSTLGARIYQNDRFDDQTGREEALTIKINKGIPQEEVWTYDPETGELTQDGGEE